MTAQEKREVLEMLYKSRPFMHPYWVKWEGNHLLVETKHLDDAISVRNTLLNNAYKNVDIKLIVEVQPKEQKPEKPKQKRNIVDRIQEKYGYKRMGPKFLQKITDRELVQLRKSSSIGASMLCNVINELKSRHLIEDGKTGYEYNALIHKKVSEFNG